jgi:hypothetical protein
LHHEILEFVALALVGLHIALQLVELEFADALLKVTTRESRAGARHGRGLAGARPGLGSRAAIGDRSERTADILKRASLRRRGRLAGLCLIRKILLRLVVLSADLRPKRRAQANRQARSHTEKNISHD